MPWKINFKNKQTKEYLCKHTTLHNFIYKNFKDILSYEPLCVVYSPNDPKYIKLDDNIIIKREFLLYIFILDNINDYYEKDKDEIYNKIKEKENKIEERLINDKIQYVKFVLFNKEKFNRNNFMNYMLFEIIPEKDKLEQTIEYLKGLSDDFGDSNILYLKDKEPIQVIQDNIKLKSK